MTDAAKSLTRSQEFLLSGSPSKNSPYQDTIAKQCQYRHAAWQMKFHPPEVESVEEPAILLMAVARAKLEPVVLDVSSCLWMQRHGSISRGTHVVKLCLWSIPAATEAKPPDAVQPTAAFSVKAIRRGLSWVAVKEFNLNYYNAKTIPFTIYPCYGNLN